MHNKLLSSIYEFYENIEMKCQTIAKNSSRLNSSTKSEDEVEGGLFLDVVVAKGPPVLELLPGEDESLLVRGDALLVLD